MNILDMLPGDGGQGPEQPADAICSRKGCRESATMALLWNNPKIHTAERRKIWVACPGHVEWLEDYLKSRSLWKATQPLSPKDSA
ncbi:acetone carboxylase [Arthrobacter sp. HY1533]|uniref:acetone carboxylase n=1 Tax=Arthrobacter sp. HY1533 TaxID=2970919 RepID=UPI0022B9FB5D|nr:acetone carboxylase [Arthrobacter sp. HY1533]